ncbi:hypothetical protein [Chryseobacterium sp. Leaf394]|uniref:hypothetical protein n=1 Tax=Chryseobacterium sp. Leaf394 TaxID=1736361 RepID=UPI0006FC072B|nr:hypothetical protein [Chryseobacterium sp. Leaf394]KQS91792.1 hypothetical protein ASG21_04855 [Chryseobacterium sp. Leaf394]
MYKTSIKILGLAVLLNFSSCTSDENVVTTENVSTNKISTSDLKLLLKNYNNNFKSTNINQDPTSKKKWWQIVGQVAAVASGDAGGAAGMVWVAQGVAGAVGAATAGAGWAVVSGGAAVIGAVGGSYAAYCSTGGHCRGTFNNTNPEGASVIYDFPREFDHLENVGVFHNAGLQAIYMDGNNINELDWANSNIPNLNSSDFQKIYNSPDFKKGAELIKTISAEYKNSNYDVQALLKAYKDNGLINANCHDILSLYFDATKKSQNFEDYNNITEYYVNQVSNSNLTDIEKESLLSAFSVSIQSFYYWLNMES